VIDSQKREELGKIVREEWVKWCLETRHHNGDESKIAPWDEMPEKIREVDRRIGEAVARYAIDEEMEKFFK
jgi:hypothetical protein